MLPPESVPVPVPVPAELTALDEPPDTVPPAVVAQQAQAASPGHKELVFGVVTGVGSAVSVMANPLFGALSDRTTSRFGRRAPWVVAGALLGALALVLLAQAASVLAMALAWSLAQASLNAMFAALTHLLPPVEPEGKNRPACLG